MAIFNYSKTYTDDIASILLSKTTDSNYIKFVITGDSHIISHGVDFTPWSTDNKYGTKSGKYWSVDYLPIDGKDNPSDEGLWTSKTISDKISTITGAAVDGMHFRGTLSTDDNKNYSVNNKAAGSFPTGLVGDTYRIIKSGIYKDVSCEVGDLIICVTADTTSESWTVAQTNINGSVEHTVNGKKYLVYSDNLNDSFEIYAPTSVGNLGQVLFSTGSILKWDNLNSITAGSVLHSLKLDTNTGLCWDTGDTYDGSAERTIKMNTASYDGFGTIKGDENTVTIKDGVLSLTKKNILEALDLLSIASVNTWRGIKIYSTNGWEDFLNNGPDTNSLGFKSGLGTTLVTNTDNKVSYISFNVNTGYTTDGRNYAVRVDTSDNSKNSNQLYVNVPWVDTTYDVVSTSANGLAPQLKETTGNINSVDYKVLCFNSEAPVWKKLPANAFLNTWRTITWGNTNIGSNSLTVTGTGHTTVSANATTGAAEINSTWRDIQVGGTSINDKILNFMPTGSIYVIKNDLDADTTGIYDVGFDIAWYNMDTKKYEYEYK